MSKPKTKKSQTQSVETQEPVQQVAPVAAPVEVEPVYPVVTIKCRSCGHIKAALLRDHLGSRMYRCEGCKRSWTVQVGGAFTAERL